MVIFKCYFSGELSPFIKKKKKKQRCEHIIRKNKQIKSTVHDANKKNEINKDKHENKKHLHKSMKNNIILTNSISYSSKQH